MKKVLSLVLVVLMLASCIVLGSCGKDDTTDGKINPPSFVYLYNTSESHKAIAEYLQAAFKNAGITMNLSNQEWATFLETRKVGDYTVARNGWVADYSDPICFLDMWISNSGNNDIQYGKDGHATLAMYNLDLTSLGYDVKVENGTWAQTYDVLIGMIKAETDLGKRKDLMHVAEDMLMDTGCIAPLYFYTDLYMIDDDLKGFYCNPLGYKYFEKITFNGKDTIDICLASEPQTLDPALNSSVDGATLAAQLFAGLAKWSQNESGELIIVPDCAEEFTEGVVGEDGKITYTYTLREGLKWSNGDELKASDFVNSWNRAISYDLAADYGYMFDIVDGYAEASEENPNPKLNAVADDAARTITITINNAISYWEELLAFPIYFPVHSSAFGNEAWCTAPETFICNGRYTMTKWDHDSLITLTKNANFYDAANVTMKTINFHLSDDQNNMLANFKNGDWQFIDEVPVNEIPSLKVDYPTEFVVTGQIGTYYICFNVNYDLLPGTSYTGVEKEKAQQEIRKALSLLIDRNYICESITQSGQVPASSFVAMGMKDKDGVTEFYKNAGHNDGYVGYYDVSKEAYNANCQKALETLKKYYKIAD